MHNMPEPISLIPESEGLLPANDEVDENTRLAMQRAQFTFRDNTEKFVGNLNDIVCNEDIKFGEKLDRMMLLNVALIPILLEELSPNKHVINPARSDQALKIHGMIKGLEASVYKKRDIEAREEVDVSHPKFQAAMDWIMEGVLMSMTELGIDDQMQSSFIHNFSQRMVGFEEEANRKLKGTSFQNIDTLDNPLVKKFNDERNK